MILDSKRPLNSTSWPVFCEAHTQSMHVTLQGIKKAMATAQSTPSLWSGDQNSTPRNGAADGRMTTT